MRPRLTIESPIGKQSLFRRSRLLKDGVAIGEVHAHHSDQSRGMSDYTFYPNAEGQRLGLKNTGDYTQSGLLNDLRLKLELGALK